MKSDLKGKIIVVTGGSSGIGAAAAKVLTRLGSHVIITGRSPNTKTLANEIGSDHYIVDFAKFSRVTSFAEILLKKYSRIDMLVNNVGAIFAKRRETPDGHEMTLQVNHLSGFLLTNLLKDCLQESKAVIINTSSAAHRFGRLDFNDLESRDSYKPWRAYGTTKLMNILHAMEIGNRFRGVNAVSFHPGSVSTGFAREGGKMLSLVYEAPLKDIFLIPPEKGADTLLWLMKGRPGKNWEPGGYYDKRKAGRKSTEVTSENARLLWEASERLVDHNGQDPR